MESWSSGKNNWPIFKGNICRRRVRTYNITKSLKTVRNKRCEKGLFDVERIVKNSHIEYIERE